MKAKAIKSFRFLYASGKLTWYDIYESKAGQSMKNSYKKFVKIREHADDIPQAAMWFHERWQIPWIAYEESMNICYRKGKGVPQWYLLLHEQGHIIAGIGVIENDFHPEKEYTPNVCALYVEEAYRRQGYAKMLLEEVEKDMRKMGLSTLYLLSDHTTFYEKCGWCFLTMIEDDEGKLMRMYCNQKE